MPIQITMPRLSDTMEEGTLVKWRVKVGDAVASGDHLADVETDKATMELQAFDDGTVAKQAVGEGDTVPVGELIMVLAEEGESAQDAAKSSGESGGGAASTPTPKQAQAGESTDPRDSKQGKPASEEDQDAATEPVAEPSPTAQPGAARVKVSPLARKLAEEHGLDLARIDGSGPDGRVVKRDILAAAEGGQAAKPAATPSAPATPAPTPEAVAAKLEDKTISLTGMRKTIAKRLVESKTTIPHFQVSMPVDMDPLLDLRKTLNAQLASQGVKLSVNDFVVRASALACVEHPMVNASWADDSIRQHGTVNLGVAVALPAERGGGLVVPVLRDAQNLGLRLISAETRRLAKKARESGLSPEEMSDGTFTLSNLGMYGVEHFTAIINPPQAAILAVGAAIRKPVVRDDQIVIGQEMVLTLSGDHRVIDGAIAAEYLQTLKRLLENPAGLLV